MIVALDRDGVINEESSDYIKSPEEWQPIPGSIEAIAALSKAGYRVFVLTNQSGLHRGLFDLKTLEAIHHKMQAAVKQHGGIIEHIFYCPHTPEENCACRKPKTGLVEQLCQFAKCESNDIVFVGDSLRDLQAAETAHCRQWVLVKTGNGEKTLADHLHDPVIAKARIYPDLKHFALTLL
ncbi:MAG: gmhB [Gammaproteobacteria bacterium]|jgi:D-glycero-D-manno-heptose 1,7-bisphosphate phosphatase|nr:gmhB [Gammaproteobacteria bacterium]